METFTATYDLPADVQTVINLITTEDYFHRKYEIMNAQNVQIEVLEDNPDIIKVAVARDVSLGDSVPSFAKKLVKDPMTVNQTIQWQKQGGDSRQGFYTGSLLGKDGGVEADLFLEPNGAASQMRIEGRVTISLPLIGRKLEKLMVERAAEAFEYDISATEKYIQQNI